jgi:hypothetical protein
MTKEERIKRQAVATIRHLESLLKQIRMLATGKTAIAPRIAFALLRVDRASAKKKCALWPSRPCARTRAHKQWPEVEFLKINRPFPLRSPAVAQSSRLEGRQPFTNLCNKFSGVVMLWHCVLISGMVTGPIPALPMRFFEFTSSNGNTAHVPVDQFLRIETFDDYQAGNGVVQILFRNADEENPYIVTINTAIGTQSSVASRIQGELSEGSNDSILIKPNMMPNVTGIIF